MNKKPPPPLDRPATDDDRRGVHLLVVAECLKKWEGSRINFERVDRAYQEMMAAETMCELWRAAREYKTAVLHGNKRCPHCGSADVTLTASGRLFCRVCLRFADDGRRPRR